MRAKRITVDDLTGIHGATVEFRPLSAMKNTPHAVAYVDSEAPGAFRNGSRLAKVVREPGDAHQIGAMATVIGSVGPMPPGQQFAGEFLYFVEWDDKPGVPVAVRGSKVARVD